MSGTAKTKGLTDGLCLLQHTKNVSPHALGGVGIGVANEVHTMLSSTEKDVNTVVRLEKSDLSCFVAAH